jgi:hypothetical protein
MFEKLKDSAAAVAAGKAHDMIREFNDTVPTLRALGLSVGNLSCKIGVPPEIGATFSGSVAAVDRARIKEMSEQHRENKTIATILEALRAASNLKDQLSEIGFRGIKVDVTLGLLPKVEVDMLAKEGA